MSEFPLTFDTYQLTNSVGIEVYFRRKNVENPRVSGSEDSITLKVNVDGAEQEKVFFFTDKIKPETVKMDVGKVKLEITAEKLKGEMWSQVLTTEEKAKKLYEKWDHVVIKDDEEDEDKNQTTDEFIRKMFQGASPEQQRAMYKSFVESNGTVLSADWNDVGSRHVDPIPPK